MLKGISVTAFRSYAIIEAVGATQAGAPQINAALTAVVVDSPTHTAVKLPSLPAGNERKIICAGGNALVSSPSGGGIVGLGGSGASNTAVTLTDETMAEFVSVENGIWFAAALGT